MAAIDAGEDGMNQEQTNGRLAPQAEAVSALVDDALDDAAAMACRQALKRSPELVERWQIYCAVGDALRSPEVGAWHRPGFAARVHERLELEPTVLAPARHRMRPTPRWLGGAAVAAAVAGLAFAALPLLRTASPPAAPVALTAQPASNVALASRSVPGVGRVDSYLRAHLELAGGMPPADVLPAGRAAGGRP
jgi:sigma-E factor negative regulatory protein RseA